ncbi:hypothetical protein SB5439_04955 [Klebsiella variicola]|uniref:hypothetical protein n=1 Tax=Klebsiella variicola TaxID=244366 RepID=UPI00109C71D2|nr:hypothetical protein [Klebsiella variicola]VGQ11468.1 hypothetical protein SB5439_04955 [Klebsiella variicola]
MIKKIILVSAIASALVACSANAISPAYRAQLEHSGCTPITEAQGCNLNMSREWNESHGFAGDQDRPAPREHHREHHRGHDRDNARRDEVTRSEVNEFLRVNVYDENVTDARQALYNFGCERLGPDHWRKDDWEINLKSRGGRVISGNVHHF